MVPESAANSYAFLLRKAAQRITDLAHEALAPYELTLRHFGVLNLVESEPGLSQRTVGARLRIDRTTIVALTDDLERAGLLERRRGADRRSYALYLTPTGAGRLRQLRRHVTTAQKRFLAPLSRADQETLRDLLLRLL